MISEDSIPIVCPYCGVGCNLELLLDKKGRPVKSGCSGRNEELNGRYICVKGFSIPEILTSAERLASPLIRKGGKFQKASWQEAVEQAAGGLKAVVDKFGPESVGLLCSGKILNEEAYLCQKFQRVVIGNNHIDNCARLCHGPSEAALRKLLGFGAVSTYLEDFEAMETVVVVGANTQATYPIIWKRLRKRARNGEINLVLADPRGTDLVKHAAVHLKAKPGTDIFWINALAKIIHLKGWHDENFCNRHTIGFHAYRKSLDSFDIDRACTMSGVHREDLEKAAALIRGKKTVYLWGMGLTQHAHGTDNVCSLVNLTLLTGSIGKRGCGVAPLRGQNNIQGACDMGGLPNLLPGHMLVDDEAARIHFGAMWDTTLSAKPGLSAPEMIHEIAAGKIRALYVVGENPVMSEPQSSFVAWMMQRLDLLIVQDIFPTETSQYAHIVLPAAAVGEKAGTFTNAARRIQHTSGGLKPPGEARADWKIIQDLAQALGHQWDYRTAEEIWNEIRQTAPIFNGVSYRRLQKRKSSLKLNLLFKDRVGIAADISAVISKSDMNIVALETERIKDRAEVYLVIENGVSAPNREEISKMLEKIPGLIEMRYVKATSQGIFWPCYDDSHPGTPRLYEDGFAFKDRRARFIPICPPENLLEPTKDYPYILITGRLLGHFNTGEMSRRSKRLMKGTPSSFVQMHPDDAQRAGLADEIQVRVTSPYGSVTSKLKISKSVFSGYLFAPNHFNTPNFNTLMSSVPLDPQARMPALKVVPVNIVRGGV